MVGTAFGPEAIHMRKKITLYFLLLRHQHNTLNIMISQRGDAQLSLFAVAMRDAPLTGQGW